MSKTEYNDLRKTLFQNWKYDDPRAKTSLRWDPADDVRHAHRWKQPTDDPDQKIKGSMLGANRLAIESLPFFVTIPKNLRLETVGFRFADNSRILEWTWPIWEVPLSAGPIRSLLALGELQKELPNRSLLRTMGVSEIFRCKRIRNGKYGNFSPAQPV